MSLFRVAVNVSVTFIRASKPVAYLFKPGFCVVKMQHQGFGFRFMHTGCYDRLLDPGEGVWVVASKLCGTTAPV